MKRLTYILSLSLCLLLTLTVLAGCDSNEVDADNESHVQILLTDAPADFVEANVLIERVELIGEDDRVILLADEPQPFDLLTLQDGITATLVDEDIPNGTYTQIRVIVDEEAFVLFDDGTTETLKIPSGSQTGIKMNLPVLDIDDDLIIVTIDFDVTESFVKRGNSGKGYIFKPVIKPLSITINGDDVVMDDEL
ncbi:MAG TPA: DUF4382 domain-containing protein [Rhodothermales bacterium]|nr:DUF4382 domain-containing protein [Rhodothermales bacterium]